MQRLEHIEVGAECGGAISSDPVAVSVWGAQRHERCEARAENGGAVFTDAIDA
jgi:hypothetical protein